MSEVSAAPYTAQYPVCSCNRNGGATIPYTISVTDSAATGGPLADWGYVDLNPSAPGGPFTQTPGSPLTNPRNSACDAVDGAGDADSTAINNGGRDLIWFAYTWDSNNLYLFTKRASTSSAQQFFVYFADIDSDQLMESTDKVIVAQWQSGAVTSNIWGYVPATAGGDSMVNASGQADGYVMPGTWGSTLAGPYTGQQGSLSDVMEISIPWSGLVGSATPTGVTFHISSLSGSAPTAGSLISTNVQDNMGGCGGTLGGTSYGNYSLPLAGATFYAPQNTQTAVLHSFEFTGWGTDYIEFTHTANNGGVETPIPTFVTYYKDDGDGVYEPGTDDLQVTRDIDGDGNLELSFSNNSTTPPVAPYPIFSYWFVYSVGYTNNWTPRQTTTFTFQGVSTLSDCPGGAGCNGTLYEVVDTLQINLGAAITLLMTDLSTAYTDPANCTLPLDNTSCTATPKRSPGAVITKAVQIQNTDGDPATNVTIVQTLDADEDLVIANPSWSGAASNLVDTNPNEGDTPTGPQACGFSGVTVSYAQRATPTNFTYTPDSSGIANTDSAGDVGAVRFVLGGSINGQRAAAPNVPTCTLQYRTRIR